MRTVDTNVLVRIVVRDDPRQAASAETFIAQGAWVSTLALAEATWVLTNVYGLGPKELAQAVEMLLDHERLVIQSADAVRRAAVAFRERPRLGFSDCLLLELSRAAGHLPMGTFDRSLGKLDGAARL